MHSALYIILLIRTCHLSGSSSLKTDFPRIYFLAFQYWNRFWSFINISCCSKIMAKMDPRANCCVKEYFKIPLKATLLAFLRIPKMPAVLRWARGFLVFCKSFCAQIKHFNSLAQKPGVHWARMEWVQGNSNLFLYSHSTSKAQCPCLQSSCWQCFCEGAWRLLCRQQQFVISASTPALGNY